MTARPRPRRAGTPRAGRRGRPRGCRRRCRRTSTSRAPSATGRTPPPARAARRRCRRSARGLQVASATARSRGARARRRARRRSAAAASAGGGRRPAARTSSGPAESNRTPCIWRMIGAVRTGTPANGGKPVENSPSQGRHDVLAVGVEQVQLQAVVARLGRVRLHPHDEHHRRVREREARRVDRVELAEDVELALTRHVGGVAEDREVDLHSQTILGDRGWYNVPVLHVTESDVRSAVAPGAAVAAGARRRSAAGRRADVGRRSPRACRCAPRWRAHGDLVAALAARLGPRRRRIGAGGVRRPTAGRSR